MNKDQYYSRKMKMSGKKELTGLKAEVSKQETERLKRLLEGSKFDDKIRDAIDSMISSKYLSTELVRSLMDTAKEEVDIVADILKSIKTLNTADSREFANVLFGGEQRLKQFIAVFPDTIVEINTDKGVQKILGSKLIQNMPEHIKKLLWTFK